VERASDCPSIIDLMAIRSCSAVAVDSATQQQRIIFFIILAKCLMI
jgi:hypothetical protein